MLPIKRVVLYKHGVGYFEREGEVDGEAAIDLHFKAGEMNDVLKTLTVFDLSGGIITSVSYESTKPIERQLEDLAIRLPDQQALSGLLDQVKGARVTVEVGSAKVEGVISGIESVTQKSNDMFMTRNRVALLVDGCALQSFDLLDIKSITLLDENLRKDLQFLLDILIASKKKDSKQLTIFAKGDGKRTLVACYVIETPVWKASYRLVLPSWEEDKKKKDKDKMTVQGWALVDNTLDEDWEGVSLSLVSGLPVSFIHDLYSPRYKRRPVIRVQEEEAYGPPVLEEGIAEEEAEDYDEYADEAMKEMAPMASMMGAAPSSPAKRAKKMADAKMEAFEHSADVQTRTVEIGDLFQYTIENPVTVKRNQSALVPILQTGVKGKKVAVYNQEIRDKNPMSCVLMTNDSKMTLEGGPVMVLEGDAYVGEAMLETLKPDEERLLPYSVELGCVVSMEQDSTLEDVHLARLYGGYLYLYQYRINTTEYIINNKADKPLDLFLEHRFIHNWELVNDEHLHEKTDNFYRFRLDIAAKKTVKFAVKEKGDETESHYLRDVNTDMTGFWLSRKYINKATKDRLDKIINLNARIAEFNRLTSNYEEELQTIVEDQERIRENLKALSDSAEEKELRERYVAEFSQGEDRLKELRKLISETKEAREAVEKQIAGILEETEYENKF